MPTSDNPFVVDTALLKRKFREAQTICHPDTWASKHPGQQDAAQALSARVNQAYQTLLDPLLRIEYILEQNHVGVSETDQVQDVAFMAEIMEARETIDEAEDREQVEGLLEENNEHISATIAELEELVHRQEWAEAKAGAIRLRYLRGIQRAAKKWLDNH